METAARAPSYITRSIYRKVRAYLYQPGMMEEFEAWRAARAAGKEETDEERDDEAA